MAWELAWKKSDTHYRSGNRRRCFQWILEAREGDRKVTPGWVEVDRSGHKRSPGGGMTAVYTVVMRLPGKDEKRRQLEHPSSLEVACDVLVEWFKVNVVAWDPPLTGWDP